MNLHDEIAAVAYELYQARGCVAGRELDDWLDAEQIVLARHAGQEIEEPEEEDSSQGEAAAEEEQAKEAEGTESEENQETDFE
jgi:Protein of unknown function (DUF2934)